MILLTSLSKRTSDYFLLTIIYEPLHSKVRFTCHRSLSKILFLHQPLPPTPSSFTLSARPTHATLPHATPCVFQYVRQHVNLFSVPHTVTEDLARQSGVTVRKITPASVREFLRRSPGSIARSSVAEILGQYAGAGGHNGDSSSSTSARDPMPSRQQQHQQQQQQQQPPAGPDIDLVLELLDFCLSDCPPPEGDSQPPEVAAVSPDVDAAGGSGSEDGGGGSGSGSSAGNDLADDAARAEAQARRVSSFSRLKEGGNGGGCYSTKKNVCES